MRDLSDSNCIDDQDELSLMKMMVLQEHMKSICNVIEAGDFLPDMISAGVFTLQEKQDVKAERTKHERASTFVTLLLQKDVAGFDTFCTALYAMPKYQNLLSMINKSLEARRFKYEDECKKAHDNIPCNPPAAPQNIRAPQNIPNAPPNIPQFVLSDSAFEHSTA